MFFAIKLLASGAIQICVPKVFINGWKHVLCTQTACFCGYSNLCPKSVYQGLKTCSLQSSCLLLGLFKFVSQKCLSTVGNMFFALKLLAFAAIQICVPKVFIKG